MIKAYRLQDNRVLAQLEQNRGPFLDFTEIGASQIKSLRRTNH